MPKANDPIIKSEDDDPELSAIREHIGRQGKHPLYKVLARKLAWRPASGATPYVEQRKREIASLLAMLPSGSGWDEGTKLGEGSTPDRIVLYGGYHHMDGESGMYDGWTDHSIVVSPSLAYDFEIRITGTNRNDVKDYLHEVFDAALREQVSEWPLGAEEYLAIKKGKE